MKRQTRSGSIRSPGVRSRARPAATRASPTAREKASADSSPSRRRSARTPVEDPYRQIFELDVAGVYRTTLDGRFLECNKSMARIFGYRSPQDLLARPATALYAAESDRHAFLARLRRSRVLRNNAFIMRRKDGRPVHILENVRLVPDANGDLTILQGTMIDVTDLKRLQDALQKSEQRQRRLVAELRRFAHHVQTAREAERADIARELHDEFAQVLTGLKLDLHWLRARLDGVPAEASARLDSVCSLLESLMDRIRRICADLRPALLDDLGLAAAIDWQARAFEQRTGISCRVEMPTPPPVLNGERAVAVFRIVQESLTNVARHARATAVEIVLRRAGRMVELRVKDNGVGIQVSHRSAAPSLGITGMRERATPWGGTVTVTRVPKGGTLVRLRLPSTEGTK